MNVFLPVAGSGFMVLKSIDSGAWCVYSKRTLGLFFWLFVAKASPWFTVTTALTVAGTVTFKLAAAGTAVDRDRKSTRLNSSHLGISYAVFCLKKEQIAEEMTVRELRRARKLTEVKMAKMLGVTQDSVFFLEKRSHRILPPFPKTVLSR